MRPERPRRFGDALRATGGARPPRGMALVAALATLAVLGTLALALHAIALRERRAATRVVLARRAADVAEGALVGWAASLATDATPAPAADPVGTVRLLADSLAAAESVHVRLHVVALADGARLLVADGAAAAGALRARRRVALALVPVIDTAGARHLVRAPRRSWIELP